MEVRFVTPQDPEYPYLCALRYRLFFQAHHLPKDILFDAQETCSLHAVITHDETPSVLAYGRLTPASDQVFQISQMVVAPEWQHQGLGRAIVAALLEHAAAHRAHTILLDARTDAMGFYQKLGFERTSDVFPSAKTGVPHVRMQKKL
jgi:predicted GNAT family N-acyltransferase